MATIKSDKMRTKDLRNAVLTWAERIESAARGETDETITDILCDNAIDTLMTVDLRGRLRDGKLCVACADNEPTIWIYCGVVRGYWYGQEADEYLSQEATQAIINYLDNQWLVRHYTMI